MPHLDDAAIFEVMIRSTSGRKCQGVCDEEHSGTTRAQTHDGVVEERLADMRIDGRERVVEADNVSVVVEGTGNVDSLLLATTEVDTLLANLGEIAGWQDGKIGFEPETLMACQ